MSQYSRGANFERRVKRYLEEQGWVVFRSAGSHSPADLIALKTGEVNLIQCKLHGAISKKDREILKTLADELQVGVMLAYKDGTKLIIKEA